MKRTVKRAAFFVLSFLVLSFGSVLSQQTVPEKQLVEEATREFQRHNYPRVVQLYREFAKSKPDRYRPLVVKVLYSQSLADLGEIDAAIEALREVLAELPSEVDSLQLHHDLANLLFLEKRYEEAKVVYRTIVVRAGQATEILSKAKERLAQMKEREGGGRKKDLASLEMMDIETALDAGQIPEGAEAILQRIMNQNSRSPQAPQVQEAVRLQARVREMRIDKARALLDEARRLYDEEKRYAEVREILEEIRRSYADVSEMPSVEALLKAVQAKLGKSDG